MSSKKKSPKRKSLPKSITTSGIVGAMSLIAAPQADAEVNITVSNIWNSTVDEDILDINDYNEQITIDDSSAITTVDDLKTKLQVNDANAKLYFLKNAGTGDAKVITEITEGNISDALQNDAIIFVADSELEFTDNDTLGTAQSNGVIISKAHITQGGVRDTDANNNTNTIIANSYGSDVSRKETSDPKSNVINQYKNERITIRNSYFGENTALAGGVFFIDGTSINHSNIIDSTNSRQENIINWSVFANNSVNDNSNQYNGSGGVVDSSGKLTVFKSLFLNNTAQRNGGAINFSQRGEGSIRNSKFSGNTAADGGAISALGALNIDESYFEGNKATDSNGTAKGGAVYLSNDNDLDGGTSDSNLTYQLNRKTTISDTEFKGNEASMGGAVYIDRKDITANSCSNAKCTDLTTTFDKVTFTGNTAKNGNAIAINNGDVVINSNTTFEGNKKSQDAADATSSDIYFNNENISSSATVTFKHQDDNGATVSEDGEVVINLENGINSANTNAEVSLENESTADNLVLNIGSVLNGVKFSLADKTTLRLQDGASAKLEELTLANGSGLDYTQGAEDADKINKIETDAITVDAANANVSVKLDAVLKDESGIDSFKIDSILYKGSDTLSLTNNPQFNVTPTLSLTKDLNDATYSIKSNSFIQTDDSGTATDVTSGYTINAADAYAVANIEGEKGKYLYTVGTDSSNTALLLQKYAAISGVADAIADKTTTSQTLSADENIYLWGVKGGYEANQPSYDLNKGKLEKDFSIKSANSGILTQITAKSFDGKTDAVTGINVADGKKLSLTDIALNGFKDFNVMLGEGASLTLTNSQVNAASNSGTSVIVTTDATIEASGESIIDSIAKSQTGADPNTLNNNLNVEGTFKANSIKDTNVTIESGTAAVNNSLDLSNQSLTLKKDATLSVKNDNSNDAQLTLDNSTVNLGANGILDTVSADKVTLKNDNTLNLDVNLSKTTLGSDKIDGTLNISDLSKINLGEFTVLEDMDALTREASVTPIDGLSKAEGYYYDFTTGNLTKGEKYYYSTAITKNTDNNNEQITFTKEGVTSADKLGTLEKAIYDTIADDVTVSLAGDTTIDTLYVVTDETGTKIGGEVKNHLTVTGNSHSIDGNGSEGIKVSKDGTLTLNDIQNISGFNTTGNDGSIANAGTTVINANETSVTIGSSLETPGNNAIYNTGELHLNAGSGHKISFVGEAKVSGDAQDAGTIYTNGEVSLFDKVDLNNIVVQSGSLDVNNLTLTSGTTKLVTSPTNTVAGDSNGVDINLDNLTVSATDDTKKDVTIDLRNKNSSDTLAIGNLTGTGPSGVTDTNLVNVSIDASLKGNGNIDKIDITSLGGKVDIANLAIISDMDAGTLNKTLTTITANGDKQDNISSKFGNDAQNPYYMDTNDYKYQVSYVEEYDNDKTSGSYEFTKFGKLSGLPAAIAKGDDTYLLANDDNSEDVDIWGINSDNTLNNGIFHDNMVISAEEENQVIKGYNNINGMTLNDDTEVTLNNVANVTGFTDAFTLNDNASLVVNTSKISGNKDSDVTLNGSSTLKVTDSSIDAIVGGAGNEALATLSGTIHVNKILNVKTNLNGQLKLSEGSLLDFANKEFTLQNEAGISSVGKSELILSASTLNMNEGNAINTVDVEKLTLANTVDLALNVDLANKKLDKITYKEIDVTNLDAIDITDISLISDFAQGVNTWQFAPIDGLTKGTSDDDEYFYNLTQSYLEGDILGTKYYYELEVKDDNGQEYIFITKRGETNYDELTGLAKVVANGGDSYTLEEDENIDKWLGHFDTDIGKEVSDGGIVKSDLTVTGNGNKIIGNNDTTDNQGILVKEDVTFTLDDVSSIGGFNTTSREGGTITNEGTTIINADTSDTEFALSDDINGTNAIHNTGELHLNAGSGHKISFVEGAKVSGDAQDAGTIYTNGEVSFDEVDLNNIVVQSGSLDVNDLTLTSDTTKLVTSPTNTVAGDSNGVNINLDNLTVSATDDTKKDVTIDLRNKNSSDTLTIGNLTGTDASGNVTDTNLVNVSIDASLKGNGNIDKIDITSLSGKVDIANLAIISDMDAGTLNKTLTTITANGDKQDNISSKIGAQLDGTDYRYNVSYIEEYDKDSDKTSGSYEFTKFGKLTGLPNAIAKADDSYSFSGDEYVDIWGIEEDGKYNNGITLNDIDVTANGNRLVGVGAINGLTISDSDHNVSFTDVANITGFTSNGAFINNGELTFNVTADQGLSKIEGNGETGITNNNTLTFNTAQDASYVIADNITGTSDNNKLIIGVMEDQNIDMASDGGVTFKGNVQNQEIIVNAGKLNASDTNNFESSSLTVTNGGLVNLGTNGVKFTDVTFNEDSNLRLDIASTDSYGSIKATDSFTIDDDANLTIVLSQNALAKGEVAEFKLFTLESDANGDVKDLFDLNFNNNLYTIKQEGDGWYRVSYSKTARQIAREHGGKLAAQDAAGAWNDGDIIADADNSKASELQDKLFETLQLDGYDYVDKLNALIPSTAPIVQLTERQIASSMFNVANNRADQSAFRSAANAVDVDLSHNFSYWLEIGGSITDYKPGRYSDVDMSSYQISTGIDYHYNGMYVGLGYMHHDHNIDAYARNIDVASNSGMIYGGYDADKYFIDALVGYTASDFDEERRVYDTRITADYNASSINTMLKGGMKYKATEALTVKPSIALKTSSIDRDSYTDNVGQRVDDRKMNIITTEVGVDTTYTSQKLDANIGLFYGYDAKKNREINDVTILNGTSYKVRSNEIGRHMGTLDAGVNYRPTENIKVGVGYQGNARKNYLDHNAKFELEIKF